MNKVIFFIAYFIIANLSAQNFDIVSGPMYGHFTDSTQNFWLLIRPKTNQLPQQDWLSQLNKDVFQYFEDSTIYRIENITESTIAYQNYIIIKGVVNKKEPKKIGENISFLVGSCSMPMPFPPLFLGKKRQKIFDTMAGHDKNFMLWLGDNVYYFWGQWNTKKQMHQQNIKSRTNTRIRNFLESCPQYAIWDDRDFGPDNSGADYVGKYNSLDIFKKYWVNPSFGLDTLPGVFSSFSHADAEFFMLDGRFYAQNSQTMLGNAQTKWLKEKLKASTANFKFIITGTQIIASSSGEDMGDYGNSKQELYDFLAKEKITGIVILSGDRHYGELLKLERKGNYSIYEMTTSPLTSIINPNYPRNLKVRQTNTLAAEPNFGKVHLLGEGIDRKCRLELYDALGKKLWTKDILLSDLQ